MPRRRGNSVIAEWRDAKGRKRSKSVRIDNYASTADALRVAEALEREGRQKGFYVSSGLARVEDVEVAHYGRRAMEEVIEEHLDEMRRKGRSAGHVNDRRLVLEKVLEHAPTPAAISVGEIRRYMHGREDTTWCARTFNFYRGHLHAFAKWMVVNRYSRTNWMEQVPRRDQHGAVRITRALTPKEATKLLEVAGARAPIYQLLLFTGLRWSEAGKLTAQHLAGAKDVIEIPSEISKNRRAAMLPRPENVTLLRRLRRSRIEGPVIQIPSLFVWKQDLDAAGVKYRTDAGQADRKCLRKTFATWLELAGVEPGVADLLMRHESTIRQKHYLDRKRLLETMRRGQRRMVAWYEEERAKAKAKSRNAATETSS